MKTTIRWREASEKPEHGQRIIYRNFDGSGDVGVFLWERYSGNPVIRLIDRDDSPYESWEKVVVAWAPLSEVVSLDR